MLKNYLKIIFRNLKKHKGYSLINLFGLSLGIAAFIVLFQYVTFEMSYENFHKNADRLYRVGNARIYKDINDRSAGCPPAVGPTFKSEIQGIEESARLRNTSPSTVIYDPGTNGTRVSFNQSNIFYADAAFMRMFSFPIAEGNGETSLEGLNKAVITKSAAKKYFGDAEPMGKILTITTSAGTAQYEISAVAEDVPENSHVKFEIILSYETLISQNSDAAYYWGWNAFNTYVLLEPQVTPASVTSQFPDLIKKYNLSSEDNRREFFLQPIKEIHLHSHLRHEPMVHGSARNVYFLAIIAVFIIVLAWVNYINLTTARSITRAREVGIRKVLGGLRTQLMKQHIIEAIIFNLAALILAVVTVEILAPWLSQLSGKSLELSLANWFVLAGVILAGATLSGIYPAFALTAFPTSVILKGCFSRSKQGNAVRQGLVVFQFVVSIVLITATVVVYHQLSFMQNKDLGAEIEQTLVVKAPRIHWRERAPIWTFKNEMLNLPQITKATCSASVPGTHYSNTASGIRRANTGAEDGRRCFFIDVDNDFFDFYDIPIVAGQNFTEASHFNESIILNEQAVKEFGFESAESAVNRKIVLGGFGGQIVSIVGVIKNYHQESLKERVQPVIYNPPGSINYFSLKIDTGNLSRTISQIKKQWQKTFPEHPFEYFFLDEAFNNQYHAEQQFGDIFRLLTILAISISCLGLFGLVQFNTEQRTKEIGVRKVLGATVSGIVALLSKEFTKWVILANFLAWPLAWFAMNQWLKNFAYRIEMSWWMFALAGGLALTIALLTVSWQALRAATANPVDSLRYE